MCRWTILDTNGQVYSTRFSLICFSFWRGTTLFKDNLKNTTGSKVIWMVNLAHQRKINFCVFLIIFIILFFIKKLFSCYWIYIIYFYSRNTHSRITIYIRPVWQTYDDLVKFVCANQNFCIFHWLRSRNVVMWWSKDQKFCLIIALIGNLGT